MPCPTIHPECEKLLREVKRVFANGSVFRKYDRHIVFVCGGTTDDKLNFRSQFLEFAKTNLPKITPLLSEDTYNRPIFDEPFQFVNLQEFEKVIAGVSGCVLVFPESPGSYAEVGYLSHDKKLREKILVANDHQEGSFLTYGPLAAIGQITSFKNVVLTKEKPSFKEVAERLSLLQHRTNRSKIELREFKMLTYDNRLIALAAAIRMLQIANLSWLTTSMRFLFKGAKADELKSLLSILIALEEIDTADGFFFARPKTGSLLEIEHPELQQISTRALFVYRKRMTSLFEAWTAYANRPEQPVQA